MAIRGRSVKADSAPHGAQQGDRSAPPRLPAPVSAAVARLLGYTITRRTTPHGFRWFCAPNGTPENVAYGHHHLTEREALRDAERRVAYRLGCSVEQLRDHAARVLGALA